MFQSGVYMDLLRLRGTLVSYRRADRQASDGSLLGRDTCPLSVSVPLNMGNTTMVSGQSKPTTLEIMIKNFKEGFSGDYGVKITIMELR